MVSSRLYGVGRLYTGGIRASKILSGARTTCPLPLLSWRLSPKSRSNAGINNETSHSSSTSPSRQTKPVQQHNPAPTPFDHQHLQRDPSTTEAQPSGSSSREPFVHPVITALLVAAPILAAIAAAVASIVSSPHGLSSLLSSPSLTGVNLHTLLAAALPASYAASSLLMLLYFCGSGSAAAAAGKVGRIATAITTVCANPVSRKFLMLSMIATQGVYAFILAWTSLVPLPSNMGLLSVAVNVTPFAILSATSSNMLFTSATGSSVAVGNAAAAAPQQWQHLAGGPPGPLLAASLVCVVVLLVSERGRKLRGRVRWEIEQGEGESHHVMAQGARLAARNYLLLLFSGLNVSLLGHAAVAFCVGQQTHMHSLASGAGAPLLVWSILCGAYLAVAALVKSNEKSAAPARVA